MNSAGDRARAVSDLYLTGVAHLELISLPVEGFELDAV